MTRTFKTSSGVPVMPVILVALLLLSTSDLAAGQARQRGTRQGQDGGGQATSGGGQPSEGAVRRGSGRSSSGDDGGSTRGNTPTATSSPAVERDRTRDGDNGRADRGDARDRDRSGDAVPYSRPREGQRTTGEAVPRTAPRDVDNRGNGGTRVIVPGGYGYYPWGYGSLGVGGYYGGYGGGYYGGAYDPYDPWYGSGGYSGYYQPYEDDSAMRLKVKPRDASVYVDGYYVGYVDQFDGLFQRLRVEPGPHRIEIRAPGFAPLNLDVRLEPDQTVTYRGELTPQP